MGIFNQAINPVAKNKYVRSAAIGGLMTGFNQANKAASKARSFVGPMNNVGGRFSML